MYAKYRFHSAIRMDLESIREDLQHIASESESIPSLVISKIHGYEDDPDITGFVDRARSVSNRIARTMTRLGNCLDSAEALEVEKRNVLACLFDLSALHTKASALTVRQAFRAVWGPVYKRLEKLIRGISSQLWSLISRVFNLAEWKISGDAGVTLLGLSGTVKIELTFK